MSDLVGLLLSVTTATWAATQTVVCGVAVARARATYRRHAKEQTSDECGRRVLLLRPVAGHEEELEERLALAGGASRVVFALRDERDDALPLAERAVARLVAQGVDARVVLTHAEGPNLKADQLARALARLDVLDARPDIVAVADSDVLLTADAVPRLVASLGLGEKSPKASFFPVACVPSLTSAKLATLGERATVATLLGSLHAFPMLVGIDRGLFVGKLFAVQTDALEAMGGFGSLRHVLGEDVELARRFATLGFGIQALPFVAHATRAGQSTSDALSRMGRWLTVVRGQRPRLLASYPLLLAGLLPLLMFAALATGFGGASTWLASASVLVAALARLAVSDEGRRVSGQERALPASIVDVLLSDVLLLSALGKALSSRDVTWRGEALRLEGGVVSRRHGSTPMATEHVGASP